MASFDGPIINDTDIDLQAYIVIERGDNPVNRRHPAFHSPEVNDLQQPLNRLLKASPHRPEGVDVRIYSLSPL
jgi:hypothetical protein